MSVMRRWMRDIQHFGVVRRVSNHRLGLWMGWILFVVTTGGNVVHFQWYRRFGEYCGFGRDEWRGIEVGVYEIGLILITHQRHRAVVEDRGRARGIIRGSGVLFGYFPQCIEIL